MNLEHYRTCGIVEVKQENMMKSSEQLWLQYLRTGTEFYIQKDYTASIAAV